MSIKLLQRVQGLSDFECFFLQPQMSNSSIASCNQLFKKWNTEGGKKDIRQVCVGGGAERELAIYSHVYKLRIAYFTTYPPQIHHVLNLRIVYFTTSSPQILFNSSLVRVTSCMQLNYYTLGKPDTKVIHLIYLLLSTPNACLKLTISPTLCYHLKQPATRTSLTRATVVCN